MKKLLACTLLLASAASYAAEDSISKTSTPPSIIVVDGGYSNAQFSLSSSDFSGSQGETHTLLGIDWNTTAYPDNLDEKVELCYFKPYNSTAVECIRIAPNASDTMDDFNNQIFGPGAKVHIRHTVYGGKKPGYPAGSDSVTFRFKY